MKRRDTFKYLLIGTIGGATIGTSTGCEKTGESAADLPRAKGYGRTPEEMKHDEKVMAEEYLNEHELATIAVLCDIILPATPTAGSASEAEVPAFIEFIVKDLPVHQLPLRGGLMWLNSEANKRFGKIFIECTPEEEIQIIEDIAYPDPDHERPEMAYGIEFFNLMRNLTLTGYYTTKMGFKDLGVNSNYANVWDGVPDHVLAEHDVDYDPEWLAKCVDQSKRDVIAEWNEEGDLLT
jgi:hypothetical protein